MCAIDLPLLELAALRLACRVSSSVMTIMYVRGNGSGKCCTSRMRCKLRGETLERQGDGKWGRWSVSDRPAPGPRQSPGSGMLTVVARQQGVKVGPNGAIVYLIPPPRHLIFKAPIASRAQVCSITSLSSVYSTTK